MITLLTMIIVMGGICWLLCKMVSIFVGIVFILAAMSFTIKMAKEILE